MVKVTWHRLHGERVVPVSERMVMTQELINKIDHDLKYDDSLIKVVVVDQATGALVAECTPPIDIEITL